VPSDLRLLGVKKKRRRRVFHTKKTRGQCAKGLFALRVPSLLGLLGVKKKRRRVLTQRRRRDKVREGIIRTSCAFASSFSSCKEK
jgi:hypothetical protein